MAEQPRERTYGNWRLPRSAGLWNLGLLGTAVLMAGIIVVIITVATVGLVPAIAELVLLALGLTSLMVRDRHGRTGIELVGVRMGWWRRVQAGATCTAPGRWAGRRGGRVSCRACWRSRA